MSEITTDELQDAFLEFFTSGDIEWLRKYQGRVATMKAPMDWDTVMDFQGIVSTLFLWVSSWQKELRSPYGMMKDGDAQKDACDKMMFLSLFYIEMKTKFGEFPARMDPSYMIISIYSQRSWVPAVSTPSAAKEQTETQQPGTPEKRKREEDRVSSHVAKKLEFEDDSQSYPDPIQVDLEQLARIYVKSINDIYSVRDYVALFYDLTDTGREYMTKRIAELTAETSENTSRLEAYSKKQG
jgi:hypothetical protein